MKPALSLLIAALAAPQETPKHGHGDRFGNPADLDGYIANLEDPGRDAWQKPDSVVKALGLALGQTACDIGAGPAVSADPLLPPASCDVALVVNTYHHFHDGPDYLRRLARALKPGGRIVNIDYQKRETPVGPPQAQRISREAFLEGAARAGLAKVEEPEILPCQYVVVLKPRTN